MASNMLGFQPLVVAQPTTSPADGQRSPKTWWAPLFGFSSQPDYMNPADKGSKPAGGEPEPAKARSTHGSFTEEKARKFRRLTCDSSSFHETMYHSAIASRLASDFSNHTSAA